LKHGKEKKPRRERIPLGQHLSGRKKEDTPGEGELESILDSRGPDYQKKGNNGGKELTSRQRGGSFTANGGATACEALKTILNSGGLAGKQER